MSWKFWERRKETPEERIARLKAQEWPKVHVTDKGALYIEVDELLYSKQGRKIIEQWAQLEVGGSASPGSASKGAP